MAEEVKVEKQAVFSYIVTRFDDGTVDVLDNSAAFEGVEPITNQEIYDDVEAVAELVAQKKAYNIAYSASHQYYQDLIKAQQAAQAAAAAKPAGEVLPPE